MDAHSSGISTLFESMTWALNIACQLKVQFISKKVFLMNTGTVKFYNSQKGFGFIQPDDGQQDVFVHATALERSGISTLSDGQNVSFDTEVDSRSGKTAVNKLELS
jgi:CspA family cold shock protein